MRIISAPIKEIVLGPNGILTQVWLQFIANVGSALTGEWSKSEYEIEIDNNGAPLIPDRTILALKGETIELSMVFNDPQTFTNAKFSIPESNNFNISFEESYLNLYDTGGVLLGGALVSGEVITLPNVSSTGKSILSGTLILIETKNNIGGLQ